MDVYAVVEEKNPTTLLGDPCLFTDQAEAIKACLDWNADIGSCETRVAIVVPMTVKSK